MREKSSYGLTDELASFDRGWSELAEFTEGLVGQPTLGQGVSRLRPGSADPEYDFLKWCSWTYLHYFEFGRITVRFLERRTDAYDFRLTPADHRETVRKMRTLLVHTLDSSSKSDRAVIRDCESWFSAVCGMSHPQDPAQWSVGTHQIAHDAASYVEGLIGLAERVGADDDHRDSVLTQWRAQLEMDHKPTDFDALIHEVARDLGQDHLNAGAIRQRHIDRWRRRLEAEHPGYDFESVMRPLIEDALLRDLLEGHCPVTGVDVIERLGVPRGPEVGRLLVVARRLWSPGMTKDQLLEALRLESNG